MKFSLEKSGCPIVITSFLCSSVHPSICPFVRPSTLSLCWDNSNTFLPRTFKLCIWVIYQIRRTPIVFGGCYIKGQGHRQFLWVFFYIPFSNATVYCDNWNIFLQRTFRLGQNVCLGKILVKFEYGSSGVCLSVHPSVCPPFLCAAITGVLFYRELSNFIRMFVWTRSWSGLNMGHLGSVCLSVHPVLPQFSLCWDNWNTFLQGTSKLCIWVIYQIRRTPVYIVFGVITSKVKVTGYSFFFFFTFLFLMLH